MSIYRLKMKIATLFALIASVFLTTSPVWAQAQEIQYDVAALLATGDIDLLTGAVLDHADGNLGATLQPVGDALRTQLSIPKGQGLVVESLSADSPSAKAGLKQNDILLTLADKPLSAPDDLTKHLKSAGESVVPLKIVRAGKPITIQVRPIYRVTIGPVEERKTEYFVGVSLEPINDALRTHLGLPADKGVIVAEVVSGTPAEKAGVKKYDILLELGNKVIDNRETFSREVQKAQDKPTNLTIVRAGKPITISITSAVRNVETGTDVEKVRISGVLARRYAIGANQLGANSTFTIEQLQERLSRVDKELQALQRIDALEKELKALREAVDRVNDNLKPAKGGNSGPAGGGGGGRSGKQKP